MFIPKTEDAVWRDLYEAIKDRPRGDLVTYEELDAMVMSGDIRGRDRWQIYRSDEELRRVDQKTLVNIRGVGYRIALAEEHLDVANTHRLRGKRQARKAWKVADATDLSQIADPSVRKAITDLSDHMHNVEARLRYVEQRTVRTEKAIKREKIDRLEAETATEDRLARLEELIERMAEKEQPPHEGAA